MIENAKPFFTKRIKKGSSGDLFIKIPVEERETFQYNDLVMITLVRKASAEDSDDEEEEQNSTAEKKNKSKE